MGAKKERRRLRAEAEARATSIEKAKKLAKKARKNSTGKKRGRDSIQWEADPRNLLRVGGDFDLDRFVRDATPGLSCTRREGEKLLAERAKVLADLQERLHASAKGGAADSVLLVVQGPDTAGKGGIVRHVVGQVDPQGIVLKAFKAPTEEERSHDFLWRVRPHLPRPGLIGVFDRSHYEDLLVPIAQSLTGRTDERGVSWLVGPEEIERRFAAVRAFEDEAGAAGVRIVKVCLVVSYEEQGRRLRERLEREDKHWKFSLSDLDTRDDWAHHQRACSQVVGRSSWGKAPWYAVPADHKWYARAAVQEILVRTLEDIAPSWPKATFDVEAATARLDLTTSPEALLAWAHERSAGAKPAGRKGPEAADTPRIDLGAMR